MTFSRYAIYFGPRPGEPLHAFGLEWFGTDPETGKEVPCRPLPGFDLAAHAALTRAPRRYALHGTLKPPFRLSKDQTYADLALAVEALAAHLPTLECANPVLRRLSGFFAVCPARPDPVLDRIAAACITELDRFRTPPSEAELARRRSAGLSDRQDRNLLRWGYPYVLEDFRFHVTLTGRVDDAASRRIEPALKERLNPVLAAPLSLRDLCIYGEPDDGSPFRIVDRFPLQSTP
ncbi:MAG: DUF1045 domain-containing protein [Alphaproteobacteria bacterium]|nr:DUF1045 domain-containing protein [Alphaproteobacteria bacterium]